MLAGILYFFLNPKGVGMEWQAIRASVTVSLVLFAAISIAWFLIVVPWRVSNEDSKAFQEREASLTSRIEKDSLEIVNLKSGAPDLEVEIKEMAFNFTRDGILSVFVWVKLMLNRPGKAGAAYSLTVIDHGMPLPMVPILDVPEWDYIDRQYDAHMGVHPREFFTRPANPMPHELEAGVFAEGWLHFSLEGLSDSQVGKSDLRLRIDTPYGKKEIEKKGISVVAPKYRMSRRI